MILIFVVTCDSPFRYLLEKGANVAAVNNDGELPIDIAEGDEMEEMLADEMEHQGKWSPQLEIHKEL